ncbi:zinc-finger homeodomain protein 6-like [Silene latifolia]|uniref:zinc-finger homeodomain protein 6-like n=1 Tax=Silene latifolia TaxID=37657 RepID=UPI003D780DCA
MMVRYRECQRNHAAHLGSHVVDGCGEFMPAGEEGTPQSLRCAACDCHRNFHRRELTTTTATTIDTAPPPPPPPTAATPTGNCYISFNKAPPMPPQRAGLMMAFGSSGAAAESSSEDLNAYRAAAEMEQYGSAKKRFRTKFTEEQKDKMAEFAERIGWKMAKQNEEQVLDLCNELGIKRQVFKVWMHNNKQGVKRKLP